MTEYEVVDALSSLRGEAATHVMYFVSVMFGYVVAAYLVGEKISRFQALAITGVYSIWAPGPILAAVDATAAMRNIYIRYGADMSFRVVETDLILVAPTTVSVAMALSWLISIIFMWQVRKSAAK